MIRILTENGPAAITITVDGRMVGDNADAVEACTDHAISQDRPVRLYLRDVSNIDERGRSLLCKLAAKGVQLSASGVYSSFVVTDIVGEQPKQSERRRRADARSKGKS